jgi:hypothetical protein
VVWPKSNSTPCRRSFPSEIFDIALDRYRALGFAYVEPDGTLHRIGSRVD